MILRSTILCLAMLGAFALQSGPRAQSDLKVIETVPADHAVIDAPSEGFSVRFDQPVDHIHSLLIVKRGSQTVATLQPRFKAAPEVLFARAPRLPPGDYKLHWSVRTLQDSDETDGEISFTVAPVKR